MKIRVVVADDFPLMRAAVVDGLRSDPGIEVVGEACDGVEALDMVRTQQPDVLVLDLGMPKLGGLGVIAKLRELQSDTRVLVMTASEKRESLVDAVGAGAAGYITKRSTIPQVCEAVMTIHGGGAAVDPALTGELLRAFAEDGPARNATQHSLGKREREVVQLVAQGMTDDEIGRTLFISSRTVQAHLARVRDKVGLRRRSQIARWASENSLG